MRGEWCPSVSVTLPPSELPPPSPQKGKASSNSLSEVTDNTASLYHRFLRTVSSLGYDKSAFDECQLDDDIVPDNWVSDEEDDSDVEDKVDPPPRAPPLMKSNSFRDLEVKWHQLMPPTSHMGSGRYSHPVHSQSNADSPVIGHVTSVRKVQAKLRKGNVLSFEDLSLDNCLHHLCILFFIHMYVSLCVHVYGCVLCFALCLYVCICVCVCVFM